jgi:glycerol-3-phosphate dehydrogenase
MLFIVPWRSYSLIGTMHTPYVGLPQDYQISEDIIQDFIDEINTAYPGVALTRHDILYVHWGFLPMVKPNDQSDQVKLVREGQIYDHEQEDGLKGLVTVVGVKYTTARYMAQKVVDLVVEKLDREAPPCQTHKTPVYGGRIDQFDDFLVRTIKKRPFGLSPKVMQHLIYNYGSEYSQILGYLDEVPAWGQTIPGGAAVLKAEVIHAIREEMAQKLTDVVQRRTELGNAGLPDEVSLRLCARLMAAELGWDQARKEQELDEVRAAYAMVRPSTREKPGAN